MSETPAHSSSDKHRAASRGAAETVAAHFPALLVEAERMAATIIVGEHGRRQAGVGEDFWQYRHFREGDGRSTVDWRRSARSHDLYVRENEREAAQTVWLWCDPADSLAFKSNLAKVEKTHRARIMTLALALLLIRAGERVGNLAHPDKPRRGEAAIRELAHTFVTDPNAPFPASSPKFQRSTVVLVSDFLRPIESITSFIEQASKAYVHGHLLQVLDPAEETWPFEGRMQFEGMGDDKLLVGRAQSLRGEYQARLGAHRDAIRKACSRAGWSFAVHHTDARPEAALLALYAQLSGQAEIAARSSWATA